MAAVMALLVILPATAQTVGDSLTDGVDYISNNDGSVLLAVVPALPDVDPEGNNLPAALHESGAAPDDFVDAFVNRSLYVSNAHGEITMRVVDSQADPVVMEVVDPPELGGSEAANVVLVTVTGRTFAATPPDTIEWEVENASTGDDVTLLLYQKAGTGVYEGYFIVVNPDGNIQDRDARAQVEANANVIPPVVAVDQAYAVIGADHGDEIQVAGHTTDIVVDAEGPVFTDVSPRHRQISNRGTVTIEFTVADEDSGLRDDRGADGTGGRDGDAFEDEPRALGTPSGSDTHRRGASEDIDVVFDGSDVSHLGSVSWREVERGVSYSGVVRTVETDGGYDWQLTAYDRVRNLAKTDSDDTEEGDQEFTLTVDLQVPEVDADSGAQGRYRIRPRGR